MYCGDHIVAECPGCAESLEAHQLGVDVSSARRDFCPRCRADLTESLLQHLAGCTLIRVQAREVRDRARQTRERARETAKESRQLRDRADVLGREAEDVQRRTRDARRITPHTAGNEAIDQLCMSRLAQAVLRKSPYPLCMTCLGIEVALSESQVRRSAQMLVLKDTLGVARRLCYHCGRMDDTLVPKQTARD
jgi:hypothetical protein